MCMSASVRYPGRAADERGMGGDIRLGSVAGCCKKKCHCACVFHIYVYIHSDLYVIDKEAMCASVHVCYCVCMCAYVHMCMCACVFLCAHACY